MTETPEQSAELTAPEQTVIRPRDLEPGHRFAYVDGVPRIVTVESTKPVEVDGRELLDVIPEGGGEPIRFDPDGEVTLYEGDE